MKYMLYFTAMWCNPCQRTKPCAEELIQEGYDIRIIDADNYPEQVKEFGIKSIPTFILIKDDSEFARMNGAKTKAELEEFFNQ